jgi:hypothetical protein
MESGLVVGIYKDYDYPDLLRQTPKGGGLWRGVRFEINRPSAPCDILVVLNGFYEEVELRCREAWLVIQEPPVIEQFPWVFEGHGDFSRVFSPARPFRGLRTKYVFSHGALPWHVDKTYDELKALGPAQKTKHLSWVTTDKSIFPGHKDRMEFLDRLRRSGIAFDLFGKGFCPVKDKYEALSPYRYSLAIENHSGPHYWTEKVSDCFLSWTMPIYYGCTNLADYFPKEAFVQIDIKDKGVFRLIGEVAKSDLWMKNRDAIAYARELVLDRYQLFPFIESRAREAKDRGLPERTLRRFKPYKQSGITRLRARFRGLYGS